jgi:hypothetical protein
LASAQTFFSVWRDNPCFTAQLVTWWALPGVCSCHEQLWPHCPDHWAGGLEDQHGLRGAPESCDCRGKCALLQKFWQPWVAYHISFYVPQSLGSLEPSRKLWGLVTWGLGWWALRVKSVHVGAYFILNIYCLNILKNIFVLFGKL